MRPWALEYLVCPDTGAPLRLLDEAVEAGAIVSGRLVSPAGASYPIRAGVPRFVDLQGAQTTASVESFGFEWNTLNFDAFFLNWCSHVAERNFGGLAYFRDKVVLDCGAGSGMHSRWMLEAGARRVISLELSQSVDRIVRENLKGFEDRSLVIQCDIARPPILAGTLDLVYCINVIQHTRDPRETTQNLYRLLAGRGELYINYYTRREKESLPSHVRFFLRERILKHLPKRVLLALCHVLATASLIPGLDYVLERTVVVRGEVPKGPRFLARRYRQAVLNTYDWHGSHEYQYYFTPTQLRTLVREAGISLEKVSNLSSATEKPLPGLALRFMP